VHDCICTDAKLRHEADDGPEHFQVYTGQVHIGTIYKASGNPTGNRWYWRLNGVENGPGPFNGFVRTLDDAKAEFAAAWGAWLKVAGLNEDTPTAQLKELVMVPKPDNEQTRLLD
jgi:hypothetical protein